MNANEITNLKDKAIEYAKKKEWSRALEVNKKIIDADGGNWCAWARTALCYKEMNDIPNAITTYEYLLDIVPGYKVETYKNKLNELTNPMRLRVITYKNNTNASGNYFSYCHKCQRSITSKMKKCERCGWYKCDFCSSCGCNYGSIWC